MGPRGVDNLTNLYNHILLTGKIPSQWRLSVITPGFKGRGSAQEQKLPLYEGNVPHHEPCFCPKDHHREIQDEKYSSSFPSFGHVEGVRLCPSYDNLIVHTAVGLLCHILVKSFSVTVSIHQGLVLSLITFSVILDELTASSRDAHEQRFWLLMCADDIALTDLDRVLAATCENLEGVG